VNGPVNSDCLKILNEVLEEQELERKQEANKRKLTKKEQYAKVFVLARLQVRDGCTVSRAASQLLDFLNLDDASALMTLKGKQQFCDWFKRVQGEMDPKPRQFRAKLFLYTCHQEAM
jgi:hypothetical protein